MHQRLTSVVLLGTLLTILLSSLTKWWPLFCGVSAKFNLRIYWLRWFKESQKLRPNMEWIIEIARTLRQFDINVAHKPVKTVSSILKKPTDKFDQDMSTGVVYKINCKNCEKRYIGQTFRDPEQKNTKEPSAHVTRTLFWHNTVWKTTTILILIMLMS